MSKILKHTFDAKDGYKLKFYIESSNAIGQRHKTFFTEEELIELAKELYDGGKALKINKAA